MKSEFTGKAASNYQDVTSKTLSTIDCQKSDSNIFNDSSYTVTLDLNSCEELLEVVNKTSIETTASLEYILDEIETMCDTIFIVPSANPKILNTTKEIRNKLPESSDLSNYLIRTMDYFSSSISDIDNHAGSQKLSVASPNSYSNGLSFSNKIVKKEN